MNKKACSLNKWIEQKNPAIQVKLFSEIKIISSRDWVPVFYVSCIFESLHGEKFEPYDRLGKKMPILLTDYLFIHHKENGFALDTPAERVRLSRLIKSEIERQVVPIQKRLKKYGYPIRFSAY